MSSLVLEAPCLPSYGDFVCCFETEPSLNPLEAVLSQQLIFSCSYLSGTDLALFEVEVWPLMAALGQLLRHLAWVIPRQAAPVAQGFLMHDGCECHAEKCSARRLNDGDELCWGAASSLPILSHC